LFSYYKSLNEVGFNSKDAFRLVKAYQDKLISTGIEMIENEFLDEEDIEDVDEYGLPDEGDDDEYSAN
jgi:hypothetical protein